MTGKSILDGEDADRIEASWRAEKARAELQSHIEGYTLKQICGAVTAVLDMMTSEAKTAQWTPSLALIEALEMIAAELRERWDLDQEELG